MPQTTDTTAAAVPAGLSARILVTGSREWTDRGAVVAALRFAMGSIAQTNHVHPGQLDITLVHGAARGLDTLAADVAHTDFGWTVEAHPANWKPDGPAGRLDRAAGHKRNKLMVDLGATMVVGFPLGRSPGTRGCLRAAHAAGLSAWVASVDKNAVTVAPYNET